MVGKHIRSVDDAFAMLQRFASERGLGPPVKILTHGFCDNPMNFHFGVGAEWINPEGGEPIRNAVAFRSVTARERALELKERMQQWANERPADLAGPGISA